MYTYSQSLEYSNCKAGITYYCSSPSVQEFTSLILQVYCMQIYIQTNCGGRLVYITIHFVIFCTGKNQVIDCETLKLSCGSSLLTLPYQCLVPADSWWGGVCSLFPAFWFESYIYILLIFHLQNIQFDAPSTEMYHTMAAIKLLSVEK